VFANFTDDDYIELDITEGQLSGFVQVDALNGQPGRSTELHDRGIEIRSENPVILAQPADQRATPTSQVAEISFWDSKESLF